MKNDSFLPLYATNFFGTLNDNFMKTLASFTVIGWLADERVKLLAMGVTAGALVLETYKLLQAASVIVSSSNMNNINE